MSSNALKIVPGWGNGSCRDRPVRKLQFAHEGEKLPHFDTLGVVRQVDISAMNFWVTRF